MKKRFTEEQIIKILQRNRNGKRAKDLARDVGVSQATIFQWKMKKLVADQALNIEVLKEVNSKKW